MNLRDHAGARVLVAEDEPHTRRLLQDILQRKGNVVEAVGDGYAALKALQSEEFDCVILDLKMPNMDGFETLRHIRAGSHQPSIQVFVLTVLDDAESVKRAYEIGANAVLSKPFDPISLLRLVASSRNEPKPNLAS